MDGWDLRCGPEECLSDPKLPSVCVTTDQLSRTDITPVGGTESCQLKARAWLANSVSEQAPPACCMKAVLSCTNLFVDPNHPRNLLMVTQ